MKEIPTGISEREAGLLRTLPEYNPIVIEVGALFGYSTIQLSEKAKKVISIDPHEGYPDDDAPSTWVNYMRNLDLYAKNNVVPIKDYFQNVDLPKADMAFIDLDGSFSQTYQCLHALDHVPIKIVHDFNRQGCDGVKKAVNMYCMNTHTIKVIDTLAIINKMRKR